MTGAGARAAVVVGGLAVTGVVVHLANALTGLGGGAAIEDWLYCGLFAVAAAACARRAVIDRDLRVPWTLAAVGVTVWLAAEAVYRASESDPAAAYPLATRALLLLGFMLAAATIALLARRRVDSVEPRLLLDGLVGGLAVASVAALLLFPGIESAGATQPGPPAVFLLADLAILAFVVVVTGLTGWRPGACWGLIAAGIVVNTVGNGALVAETTAGSFQRGGPVDSLFVASALALGVASTLELRRGRVRVADWRPLAGPAAFALVAVGVLTAAGLRDVTPVAVALAAATLTVLVARTALAFQDNRRLLERARHEAVTDALTGLGNRRRLARDFERMRQEGGGAPRGALMIFDLDGFKGYNDAFGHPAGDALLARIAASLAEAAAPHGAYRVGGDEFCVLATTDRVRAERLVAASTDALSERGEAFVITASCGVVSMPDEARTIELALQLADRRMYAHKDRRRTSAPEQVRSALKQLLDERLSAATAERNAELAALCRLVGARMGLGQAELDDLARAAELHDVGLTALPAGVDAGATAADRLLLEQVPLVGERILAAAPALTRVARIVRACHERYGGDGHPDGLAGQDIPLAARIVAGGLAFLEGVEAHPAAAGPTERWLADEPGLDPFVVAATGALADELELGRLTPRARRVALAGALDRQRAAEPPATGLGIGEAG